MLDEYDLDDDRILRRYYYDSPGGMLAAVEENLDGNSTVDDAGDQVYIALCDDRGTLIGVYDKAGVLVEELSYNASGLIKVVAAADPAMIGARRSQYIRCGWTGLYHEPFTGLYHAHYRDYHPLHSRWLTEDPFGYQDGLNLYAAYMGVNGVDPMGGAASWVPTLAGGAIGGIAGGIGYAALGWTGNGYTLGGFMGAVLGGAAGGAVTGAIVGAATGDVSALTVIGASVAGGVAEGFTGSIIRQGVDDGRVDWADASAEAAISGMLGGAVPSAGFGLKKLRSLRAGFGDSGRSIDAHKEIILSHGTRLAENFANGIRTDLGQGKLGMGFYVNRLAQRETSIFHARSGRNGMGDPQLLVMRMSQKEMDQFRIAKLEADSPEVTQLIDVWIQNSGKIPEFPPNLRYLFDDYDAIEIIGVELKFNPRARNKLGKIQFSFENVD